MDNRYKEVRKPKPFIAPDSTLKATAEEIKKREEIKKKALDIGEKTTEVDSEEGYENPYRVKALTYIVQGKQVPEELKLKIDEFDIKTGNKKSINNHKKAKKIEVFK